MSSRYVHNVGTVGRYLATSNEVYLNGLYKRGHFMDTPGKMKNILNFHNTRNECYTTYSGMYSKCLFMYEYAYNCIN